jgi:hypothetical protein
MDKTISYAVGDLKSNPELTHRYSDPMTKEVYLPLIVLLENGKKYVKALSPPLQ